MAELLRIGIAGLGTVGGGTVRLLQGKADLLAARAGRRVEVVAASARDPGRERGLDLGGVRFERDALALAAAPDIDAVVELIGGAGGVALDLVRAALESGKAVVTANKAMLALHGGGLALLAERQGVPLLFEAAVAGGIPIVKSLREGLAANRVRRVYGILNGTCNYILTQMRETGRDFAEVLAEAQGLGYAEADPSTDVDGIDAAHKLALLAAIAFGGLPSFEGIHVEGIRRVSAQDIAYADALGYRIKLLGVARRTEAGVEQRLHPCMVRKDAAIAQVEGVFNGIVVEGDEAGEVVHEGRGAGAGPTASAVVADLIDIARGRWGPVFGVPAAGLEPLRPSPLQDHAGRHYVRLMVQDRPGVLAEIAAAFRDHDVSIESLLQQGRDPGRTVAIVLITHEAAERAMRGALAQIGRLEAVEEPPCMIRIEAL
ncbi:MAG: homoserine dehydrogenase [Geminicoccaceae bacterium]|nr:homoserine dehydrogenase [Geminicoccaceae bacterium]